MKALKMVSWLILGLAMTAVGILATVDAIFTIIPVIIAGWFAVLMWVLGSISLGLGVGLLRALRKGELPV